MPEVNHEWGDIAMELTNKIRWAIGSTLATTPVINLPYTAQMALASVLANDALTLIKAKTEKPDLVIDRKLIRKVLTSS